MGVRMPGNAVVRSFVSETIVMDVDTGIYYRLDRERGAMLECLLDYGSIAAAAAALADAGWGTRHALVEELTVLFDELEKRALVERVIAA